MAAPARAQTPLTVALLGRADAAREMLHRALEDLGAQIVFEGDPATLQSEQVLRAGAQVVLVNLTSGVEDDIDHLQALFDSPDVNVVFNEADVTSQLAGWDLARWARHLAAKVLGREPSMPPPPQGAEPVPVRNLIPVPGAPPTPEQVSVDRPIEEFMIEAEERVEGVPSDHLPYMTGRTPPVEEEPAPDFRIDTSEVESALKQIDVTPSVEERSVPEPEVPEIVVHEGEEAEFDVGLDLAALDKALELERAPPPPTQKKSDAALLDEALADFDMSLGEAEDLHDEADTESVELAPVALTSDTLDLETSEGGELDEDVAALAAQLEALDSGPRGEVKDLDFGQFSEEEPATPSKPAPAAAAKPVPGVASKPAAEPKPTPAAGPKPAAERQPVPQAPAKTPSFGSLDLTPLDEDVSVTPTPPAKQESTYDFSGLNLSLESIDDESGAAPKPAAPAPVKPAKPQAPAYDFSGLDLSLEPTEDELEAVPAAPAAVAVPAAPADEEPSSLDELFAAMDLSPGKAAPSAEGATIGRVIVLGASIGGPDALRTFLAGIPTGFPALFLLAQHLENGFFERLAQQLQKSSRIPVRVPEPGRQAVVGEVLVMPAHQRVRVEPDGRLGFAQHVAPPKYTPCIDDVLRDAADRFGANATAIIFSGMAGDAIEGAVYLTTQGGQVWAQDPASCVVSSMVDGARARGVVEFSGSPRELAERCVAMYGKT